MPRLLTAQRITILTHLFKDVAVTHRGLNNVDAVFLHRELEPQVAHDRNHERVILELAGLVHSDR